MKKLSILFVAAIFALSSCENEEPTSVDETIDSSIEEINEQGNVVIQEELEIEEFEEIQNQFFSEVDDLDLSGIEGLNLEIIDFQNEDQASGKENVYSGKYKRRRPKVTSLCLVKNADRCPFSDRQPAANLWWPENEKDFFVPTAYFASNRYHRMIFATFDNGTALIRGTTRMNEGKCKVYVNVWLKDKRTYDEFTAIGGEFKLEPGCASKAADPAELLYYEFDSKRSWLYSWGKDCLGKGCFGLEQRGENLRGQLGPNGAGFDSNIGEHGFSNWGWITDKHTGERLWVMDFDFRLRCCPKYH